MANRSGYCFKHDWGIRSQHYVDSDRALWQGKTIYSEHSFFKHTADTLGIDFIDEKDQARDLDHPGYLTNRLAAEQISQKFNVTTHKSYLHASYNTLRTITINLNGHDLTSVHQS